MKYKLTLSIAVLFIFGCTVTRWQQKGVVEPQQFHSTFSFETYKGVIGLDVDIDGATKKFLFDTGADLTLIQTDSITGRKSKWFGASNRKMELGQGLVPSIKIGEVAFKNTYALNGDMVGLKEQIADFGGILGQSVIGKANWLIDYPNKVMEVSNKNLVDDSFKEIRVFRKNGNNPYTYLRINGKEYVVIIDLGSSSTINLPNDSEFGKDIAQSIELSENTRERYTLGGLQQITEQVGIIPKVTLGEFVFENVEVNINTSSQPRIGMNFFKDYSLYIDNANRGAFKLKKTTQHQ
jgi:predicted aspartyl protease